MRTILLPLELQGLIRFFLPHLSSGTESAFIGSSTRGNMTQTALSRSYTMNLKYFFAKALVTHKSLWTPTRKRLRGTPRTS